MLFEILDKLFAILDKLPEMLKSIAPAKMRKMTPQVVAASILLSY